METHKSLNLKEHDVLKSVRDYLHLQGFKTIRNLAGIGSLPGLCDLIAVKDDYSLWIETKSTNGKLSADQVKFKEAMADHGVTVHVIRDVAELDPILKQLYADGKIKTYHPALF